MRTLSKLALAAAILASASATKAAALFQRSVTISEKAFGKDGAAVGKALGDLAECISIARAQSCDPGKISWLGAP